MITRESIAKLTIEELLQRWPQTAEVFHRHQMACVGCTLAPFCSLGDAVCIYQLKSEAFLTELLQVIGGQEEMRYYDT